MPTKKPRAQARKKTDNTLLIVSVCSLFFILILGGLVTAKKYPGAYKYLKQYVSGFYKKTPWVGEYDYHYSNAENFDVHGIDISHHQGRVEWDHLKKCKFNGKPISFVFMKATEGATHVDTQFDKNWQKSAAAGLLRGAYHYYKPNTDPKDQANHFIRNTEIFRGDLPPVLDLEENGGLSDDALIKGVKEWLRIMENHYEVKPIIYVNAHYYKRYIRDNFDDYPVWIAHYTRQNQPRVDESEWHFWQYSETGNAAGIRGKIDLNVFNGSFDDLQSLRIP